MDVLTLFISEDKRDELAGTAWPFDSLLEHTNRALQLNRVGHPPSPSQGTLQLLGLRWEG